MKAAKILPHLILLAFCSPTLAETTEFKGTAFTSKDKSTIAYFETHEVSEKDGRPFKSKTVYQDPSGKQIAVLECDYSKNTFLPDFTFLDQRTGYWEQVRVVDGVAQVEYKESAKARVEKLKLKAETNLSGSQGLNQFIVSNLQAAIDGQDVVTSFLLPARLTAIDMIVTAKTKPEGQAKIELKLRNPFLRLFAPSLELHYEVTSKRLLRYFGNSNIYTSEGDKQRVLIEYTYANPSTVAMGEVVK